MGKNKIILSILGIILIGLIASLFLLPSSQEHLHSEGTPDDHGHVSGQSLIDVELTGETKEFDIVAKEWEFSPSVIGVNLGDVVKLNIESVDVAHGISIGAFGVRGNLNPGEKIEIEFIADKSGEFNFFCSIYCGEGHGMMKGVLIVR